MGVFSLIPVPKGPRPSAYVNLKDSLPSAYVNLKDFLNADVLQQPRLAPTMTTDVREGECR